MKKEKGRGKKRVSARYDLADIKAAAEFLENEGDTAAAKILAGTGALMLLADDGPFDQAARFQVSGPANADASNLVTQLAEEIGVRDYDAKVALCDAAVAVAGASFYSAYLIGVAVGRRLGPQSFVMKAGAR